VNPTPLQAHIGTQLEASIADRPDDLLAYIRVSKNKLVVKGNLSETNSSEKASGKNRFLIQRKIPAVVYSNSVTSLII
jgi:hypothetical protein